MLRDFLQIAARRLGDQGFTRFVDFASGLPTEDHIHAVLPDAKVVYSDATRTRSSTPGGWWRISRTCST
jgi:hypothetical protein